jgi:hypothetical protein
LPRGSYVIARHTCARATCLSHATLGGGASEKTQACVSLSHAALPMLTRERSACASEERAKALFHLYYGTPKPPRKLSCCLLLKSRVPSGLRVDQVCTWFVNMRKRVWRRGLGLPAGTRLPVKGASFPKQVQHENFAEASLARGGDAEKILHTGLRTASPRDVVALSQGIPFHPANHQGQSISPMCLPVLRLSGAPPVRHTPGTSCIGRQASECKCRERELNRRRS